MDPTGCITFSLKEHKRSIFFIKYIHFWRKGLVFWKCVSCRNPWFQKHSNIDVNQILKQNHITNKSYTNFIFLQIRMLFTNLCSVNSMQKIWNRFPSPWNRTFQWCYLSNIHYCTNIWKKTSPIFFSCIKNCNTILEW